MLTDESLNITGQESLIEQEEKFQSLDIPSCIHHAEITQNISLLKVNHEEASLQLCKLFDFYMEQPTLLDQYLPIWVPQLISLLHEHINEWEENLDLCLSISKVLYSVFKVRGVKTNLIYFRHEIEDFVPVISFADEVISANLGPSYWTLRYISILMVSMVLLVPFDLGKFSQKFSSFNLSFDIIKRLNGSVLQLLDQNGREKDAAVLYAATLFKRPDYFKEFEIFTSRIFPNISIGRVELVCHVSKILSSDSLVNLKDTFIMFLKELDSYCSDNNSYGINKCRVKLYGRLSSILDLNDCLCVQFQGIGDPHTTVRWASAKEIRRICQKLSTLSILKVLQSLLNIVEDNFNQAFPDANILHGITLALAELARFRLIPKDHIHLPIKWIILLLKFEIPRGRFAVGSAVRDAACYFVWSLVRSYSKPIDQPYDPVSGLVNSLICMGLFDREVNCRRAAAAAFQELVGRWENIPSGIELMSQVNFFNTNHRRICFGDLGEEIALKFPIYHDPLIDHLMLKGITSWDREIRGLSSSLLSRILTVDASKKYLDYLLELALNPDDIGAQHGGIITLSLIVKHAFEPEMMSKIIKISTILNDLNPKAFGWDLLADAVCRLIKSLAELRPAELDDNLVSSWLKTVQSALQTRDNLLHQLVSDETLPAVVDMFPENSPILSDFFRGVVLPAADKDRNLNAQRGFTLAIGAMPLWLFHNRYGPVNKLMCKLIQTPGIIEKRVNAVISLGRLHNLYHQSSYSSNIEREVLDTFINCLDDYTVDARGDIGSLIRSATIQNMIPLTDPLLGEIFTAKLLRFAVEKLDKLRSLAVRRLAIIKPDLLANYDQLISSCFNANEFFQLFQRDCQKLMDNPIYQDEIVKGLISSAGSINRLVGDPALSCLSYCLGKNFITREYLYGKMSPLMDDALNHRPILQCLVQLPPPKQLSSELLGKIRKVINDKKANMFDLLNAVRIISEQKDQESREWVRTCGIEHEFAKVRELFIELSAIGESNAEIVE